MLPLSRYLLTEEKPYEALQDFCDDMAIIMHFQQNYRILTFYYIQNSFVKMKWSVV